MLNKKKINLAIIFLCILVLFLSFAPKNTQADSITSSRWDWTAYKYNDDHCAGGHTNHLVIRSTGASIDFYGHRSKAYFECALTNPQSRATSPIDTEFFNFQINEAITDWHTLDGSGFIFNADFDDSTNTINHGYCVLYKFNKVYLYEMKNVSLPAIGHGSIWEKIPSGCSVIHQVSKPGSSIHNISIQATQTNITMIDNNIELLTYDITPTGGWWFGPAVQWGSHWCNSESHIQFSQVLCGLNITKPVAGFNYNTPSAELRDPVYVIPTSYDTNTPKLPLTQFWTVIKKGENGAADTVLWKDQNTPFTGYNSSGIGTYVTSLRVKNSMGFFSDNTVTKTIVITGSPQIEINPGQTQYNAGDTISFTTNKWWNCSVDSNKITIKNVISDNLILDKIFIPGSNGIDGVSGEIGFNIKLSYKTGDDSLNHDTQRNGSIPPTGLTEEFDEPNLYVDTIEITLDIPSMAGVKDSSGIIYSFKTSEDLSKYYTKGSSPRIYEATNTVTLTSGKYSVNKSAKISFIEPKTTFFLKGTIDNCNAITTPPKCNTEFFLSGKTIGGESIAEYINVDNGMSDTITIPYGTFSLSEVKSFETGFEPMLSISLNINNFGININEETTVPTGAAIPFTKKLLVSTLNVSKEFDSAGLADNSGEDYVVRLTGIPIVSDISVDFELTSNADKNYHLNDLSSLIVPVGTYNIEEIRSSNEVSLKNISVTETPFWDRICNYVPNKNNRPAISFAAEKGRLIPVILKYASDKYVYDEYTYNNSLVFSIKPLNANKEELLGSDKERVVQDPNNYQYPICLINESADLKYYGIATVDAPIAFSYMFPGTYRVECSNNMYMDINYLKALNDDEISFEEKNGTLYVTIPDAPAEGSVEETQTLTAWRGYSDFAAFSCKLSFETSTHVSLSFVAKDQDVSVVPNCKFEFLKDGVPIYFKSVAGRYYPSSQETPGAFCKFTTDENGKVDIYKMPEGKYEIHFISLPQNIYPAEDSKYVTIDGTRNIGVELKAINLNKLDKPVEVSLSSSITKINPENTLQLIGKVSPSTAYGVLEYYSSDETIATVSPSGLVTGKKPGQAIITAVSSIDQLIKNSITVTVADPSVIPVTDIKLKTSSLNMTEKETYSLAVSYTPSDATNVSLTWESSDPDVAAVDSNGVVTAKKDGTAKITAKCGELTSICNITVGKLLINPTKIELNSNKITLISNHSTLSKSKLTATVFPDNASDPSVTFKSSNPEIVSVDVDGNIAAHDIGTAVITATTSNGISAACAVSAQPIVEFIKLNVTNVTVKNGSSFDILPTISPLNVLNPTLTWSISDTSVATISSDGKVKTLKEGTAKVIVTATYEGTDDVESICEVTVTNSDINPTNVDVSLDDTFNTTSFDTPIEIDMGESTEFYARVRPISSTHTKINWTFSKPNVIAIEGADDSYSDVNAVNKYKIASVGTDGGQVTVIGTVDGFPSIKTTFVVDVVGGSSAISITRTETSKLVLGIPNNDELSAQVTPNSLFSKITSVDWEVFPADCVSIIPADDSNSNVTLKATKTGIVNVVATAHFRKGDDEQASFSFEIVDPEIIITFDGKKINPTIDNMIMLTGESKLFVVEYNYKKDGNSSGFEVIHPTEIAATAGPNPANGHSFYFSSDTAGDYTLHVTPSNSIFDPFDIVLHVVDSMPKATGITLTDTSLDLKVGDSTPIHADITPSIASQNPITWTSDHPEFAEVDDNGKITAIAEGVATITATVDDVSSTCIVTVTAADTP